MRTEQKDILNTQLSTGNNHNSNSGEPPITGNYTIGMEDINNPERQQYIVKTKSIPGSPFHILYREGIGYTLTVGNHLITVPFETEDELLKHIQDNAWNITTALIIVISERMKKEKENTELNSEVSQITKEP